MFWLSVEMNLTFSVVIKTVVLNLYLPGVAQVILCW